jgi:hypothetical protein
MDLCLWQVDVKPATRKPGADGEGRRSAAVNVRLTGYPDTWMLSVVRKVRSRSRYRKIAFADRPNRLASQCWRFAAHEVRVISFKKEALQTLSISKNLARNPLTFRAKEIDESVDCGGKTLV